MLSINTFLNFFLFKVKLIFAFTLILLWGRGVQIGHVALKSSITYKTLLLIKVNLDAIHKYLFFIPFFLEITSGLTCPLSPNTTRHFFSQH